MDIPPASQQALHKINGFSSTQAILLTYLVAKKALAVPGCFVECGVANGGGSAPMAVALSEVGDPRTLHLFDSFQGLPFCGPHDKGQIGYEPGNYLMDPNLPLEERLKPTNIAGGPIEAVEFNFKSWGVGPANVEFHKGWFQHTLPGIKLAPIAFLRLDGDLYESTMCCLENLYGQVAPGGYVWLDEWGMPDGIGGKQAFFDFFAARNEPVPTMLELADTGAGYWKIL